MARARKRRPREICAGVFLRYLILDTYGAIYVDTPCVPD